MMNSKRRKKLLQALELLHLIKDSSSVKDAKSKVLGARNIVLGCIREEEMAIDNRPKVMEYSTVSQNIRSNIYNLCLISDEMSSLLQNCEEINNFDYLLIRSDVVSIVNGIKEVIGR